MNRFHSKNLLCILLSAFLLLLCCQHQENVTAPEAPDTTANYYVSVTGDNSNKGTFDSPLKTIQAGIDSLQPGQTLYIREGVYQERIVISESKSGALEKPTIIRGYPGETPVITGDYSGIGSWNLVLISGSHILFGNAEVSYSSGRGINVYAGESEFLGEAYANSQKYVTLADVEVHHTKNAGIIAEWADNLTIQNCVLWQNNQINNPDSDFFEDCCWSGAVTVRRGSHFLLEDNKIYESYGEGMNIHGGAIDVTIQDNVVYNTWAPAIYPINSRQITIQRNLIYHTNDSRFLRHNNPPQGIMMGNEHYHMQEHAMTLEDVNVINNMIKGFQINVGFWYNGFESESALVNVLIAHNTLVDAHANTEDGARASIWIQTTSGGVHEAEIKNNVILQNDESNGLLWVGDYDGNMTLDYNCWSVTPERESMMGEHALVADPILQKDGQVSAGELAPEWFKLNKNSPVANAGILLDQVSEDYFGISRDSRPDIGAHEYQ